MKIHSSLALLALAANLHAQTPPPQDPSQLPSPEEAERNVRNVTVCYETFSVPLALAAKLQRDDKADADLYTLLAAADEKNDGIRQESFDVLRCKPFQKAVVECVSERIYPCEYEPPSVPGTVGVSIVPAPVKDTLAPAPDTARLQDAPAIDSLGSLRAPVVPSAFETRNTGRVMKFETAMADNPQTATVQLKISPEHVTQVGRSAWGQGLSKTELPTFETQRITTDLVARVDQPLLLGTASRPPVSKMDPDSAQRVWFAFATVTIVKP